MSWYVRALSPFFIDSVQVGAYSGEHLVLMISGKRYEYSVAGNPWASKIDALKKVSSPGGKAKASVEVSQIIRNLEQFRI